MELINKFVNAFIIVGVVMGFVYWVTNITLSHEHRITVLETKFE